MVVIDESGFASLIQNYLINPTGFKLELVDAVLCKPVGRSSANEAPGEYHGEQSSILLSSIPFSEKQGITFGYTGELVMVLLLRAFNRLLEKPSAEAFAERVSKAFQDFARPFPGEPTMCYPHFLLHGIANQTLEGVAGKIEENSRIIHETIANKGAIVQGVGRVSVQGDLYIDLYSGLVEDYFGIACVMAKKGASLVSSASNYIAKASFFVDATNGDLYVLTIQGGSFKDGLGISLASAEDRLHAGEREYARINHTLGMSPRRFVLAKLMEIGKKMGYKKIRVVKPEEHPMFIGHHQGFFGGYELVIRKAGIAINSGCYFEGFL